MGDAAGSDERLYSRVPSAEEGLHYQRRNDCPVPRRPCRATLLERDQHSKIIMLVPTLGSYLMPAAISEL